MCHSSSWFFAAALSSSLSLSHSLSTLFIYSFCSASASRASLRNARDLREYRSHVFGFLDFFFFLMCKFFLCPLTWCTHTITHAHVQRVFSRQSSLEKTTTNKAPRRYWTTTAAAATTTARQRQRSNRATIWLFSTLATMKFYFSFFVPVAVVYVCVFQLFFSPLLFKFFSLVFFFGLKRHKRSTNRTVQRSTHEWIDSVASDSNTATNQFYISPPHKYSKYKLYTCTHTRVCVCYAYAARWEQQRWKLFAAVHMFVWECIYMYVCVCVCIGVVLSLTHIQFVAALPLPLLVFLRAFICRVVVCSFAAASTRHLAEIFRLRWFSIEREKKNQKWFLSKLKEKCWRIFYA